MKGVLLSPGPGWGCASQRRRGTSGPGTVASAGLWLPCAPWLVAWGQSKVTAFFCPRGHEGRATFSSGLSPQPTTPQTLAPLLSGPEDAPSQARLRLRTPRNSRLLRDPNNFSASPEPARTQADFLCTGYSGAQAQRPGSSGGALAPLAVGSILCSDCSFRNAGHLLPGCAGRARAASAEAGRGDLAGGGRWAGVSAFAGEQRAPKGTGGRAGQARRRVPRAGRPAEPPSPRSPPSVPGSWAPPCPGYPPRPQRPLRS